MKLSELFWKCHAGVKYLVEGDNVHYAFTEEGKHLYIWFQSSADSTDWKLNIDFAKKPYKGMEIPYFVHRGFLKAWKTVEDIIISKITEKDKDGSYLYDTITTVGYSHGAAISGLCHECLWYHRPDIRESIRGYGFGSPRFYKGFKVDRRLISRWENYTVVRIHLDIVTHLPPWLLRFTHVGNMIHIKPKDTTYIKRPHLINSHHYDVIKRAIEEWEEKDA